MCERTAIRQADLTESQFTFVNEAFRVILFLETIDMFTQEVISDATVNKLNLLADLHERIL